MSGTAVIPAADEPVPAKPPTREERIAAAEKYKPTDDWQERDALRREFFPLRSAIGHAANGDRGALTWVLHELVNRLHDGPIPEDVAADHLRQAGAMVALGRPAVAAAAPLAAARALLPVGPATEAIDAAITALALAPPDEPAALAAIDAALDEAVKLEAPPPPPAHGDTSG